MATMLREKDRLKALLGPEARIRSPFLIILPNHRKASLPLRMFIQELRKRAAEPRPRRLSEA